MTRRAKFPFSATMLTVRLTAKPNDKAVFGVIVKEYPLLQGSLVRNEVGERFAGINALGEGRVWVTNANGGH